MGYTTIAYGVDIDKLAAVKGSRDQRLLAEMELLLAEEEQEAADSGFSDSLCPLSLRAALERILADEIEAMPNGNHQYVYAMELLCRHLGKALDDCGHVKYLEDLGWEVAMDDFRTPLDLPQTFGFPDTCYLTAEEVRKEYERFRDVDPDDDEHPDIAESREEYVGWLKQCVDEGLGLVTFCY
jgi:hypothetical protein